MVISSPEESVQRNAPKNLDRGAQASKLLQLVLQGMTDRQIAAEMGVASSSVTRWRHRNQDIVDSAMANVERAVEEYAVARKAWRIAKLDDMAAQLDADLQDAGYTYREQTRHGEKIHAHPAASELRQTLQQAALEMDQLPRAGITIANQNVVIVKQVTTEDANPEL